jgi:hypothetical protein
MAATSLAAKDGDADVRTVGIRIARQAKLSTKDYLPMFLKDASPVVLREAVLALREDQSEQMPQYWAELASRFDGEDRWYLEALGIAAMDRWSDCLNAYKSVAKSNSADAARLIAWRGRGSVASSMLAQWLVDERVAVKDRQALQSVARSKGSADGHRRLDANRWDQCQRKPAIGRIGKGAG